MRRPRFFLNSILGVVVAAEEHAPQPPQGPARLASR